MPGNCVQRARRRIAVRKSMTVDIRHMRIGGALAALGISGLIVLAACKPRENRPPTPEERQAEERQRRQDERAWGDRLSGEISYFREPRSGLCFAYLYVSDNRYADNATGGPAMSAVECAKVERLLINAAPAATPEAP